MSKKAEEASFDYQRELGMIDSVSDEHIVARRMGFQDGYKKAEKDLALTWEDIHKIVLLTSKVSQEFTTDNTYCEVYEEVLKRFNEYKEGKK